MVGLGWPGGIHIYNMKRWAIESGAADRGETVLILLHIEWPGNARRLKLSYSLSVRCLTFHPLRSRASI